MNAVATERPILFRPELVKAILDGRKVQTRRLVKPQPDTRGFIATGWCRCDDCGNDYRRAPKKCKCGCSLFKTNHAKVSPQFCPFGKPGDVLWVRETWQQVEQHGATVRPVKQLRESMQGVCFKADGSNCPITHGEVELVWRPSIHMPRWASRLSLEITGVRVERLKEISEADAIAEGFESSADHCPPGTWLNDSISIDRFARSWDANNKPGAQWADNPWLWVLEFKVTR